MARLPRLRALHALHALGLCLGLLSLATAWSCAATWTQEGLDVATLPVPVQPDYRLFAHRCSKCHGLARSLTSGIDEDSYWVDYVARMRRQPASGISAEDTVGILRFLHYFSNEERKKHGKPLLGSEPDTFVTPAPSVVPTPAATVAPVVAPTAVPAPPPPPVSAPEAPAAPAPLPAAPTADAGTRR